METLLAIILIVFGILQIILFFKIWGMTNDIREMKNKYINSPVSISTSDKEYHNTDKFKIGDLVVSLKTGKQMRIKGITPSGKYSCYSGGGVHYDGDFDENEIKMFGE